MFNLSPKKFQVLAAALLIFSAAWIGINTTLPGGTSHPGIEAPQQGFLAPDFTLETIEGVTLSELRGHPILLNFWASWCPPCRQEMPAMERMYQEYKDTGFIILAVNTTFQDTLAEAQSFIKANGLNFHVLLDQSGEVSNLYLIQAMPTSFFIDKEGIIRDVVIGGPMAEALLRTRIEKLFGEGE
jgi:peroxiredoxin